MLPLLPPPETGSKLKEHAASSCCIQGRRITRGAFTNKTYILLDKKSINNVSYIYDFENIFKYFCNIL